MQLVPNSWGVDLTEVNHCHGVGRGHPCEGGSRIHVGGREIEVVRGRQAAATGDQLVQLNVAPFDAAYSREGGFYLNAKGENRIGKRYERVAEFLKTAASMHASEVHVDAEGRAGFSDGRHRYAYLRDQGLTTIPVTMSAESIRHARRYGMLAPLKRKRAA